MAKKARVLTTEDFSFSGIIVTKKGRGSKAIYTFVDRDGIEIDRKVAQRREYSSKYRSDNPEAAKQSSREYAARVRSDAKAWRDANEVDEEEDDEDNS